jgi:hypothetical protein
MAIDAAPRRCAGRLATLQHDPTVAARVPADTLRIWQDWIARSLRLLASGSTALSPRPDDAGTDVLARIARQTELMAGAMERLLSA